MENTNREVKIAIIIGLIMITLCIVAFIVKKHQNSAVTDMDIHVYKHVVTNATTKEGVYYECNVSTDVLRKINLEFTKAMNLKDSSKKEYKPEEGGITGNYKVSVESNFIAFDDSKSNVVYRNDTTSLYNFNSTIYEMVEKTCQDINLNQNTQEKKDTKDTKDTKTKTTDKKDTKTKKSNKK